MKIKDTSKSKEYFNTLIKRYGQKKLEEVLELQSTQIWRLKSGRLAASKNVRKKLALLTGEPYEDITKKILPTEENKNLTPYPLIRKAISENAFFYDQFEDIYTFKGISNHEKILIAFYYLIIKGHKTLDSIGKYMVITDSVKNEAVMFSDGRENLVDDFKNVIGQWIYKNGKYFFQHANSTQDGITFLESFDELVEAKKFDKKISLKLKEII